MQQHAVVAIMVDLGWPWWVTSVIAIAIALGSLLAFAFTHAPAMRGVLATLAVEGVVLAAVAPAVMSQSQASPAPMRPTQQAGMAGNAMTAPSTTLTRSEFARQADANCARLGRFAASLGSPKTPAETARMLGHLSPVFWEAWLAQGTLVPPDGQRSTAKQWMRAMQAYGSALEGTREAASRGDKQGLAAADATSAQAARRSALLSSELGLKVCFH